MAELLIATGFLLVVVGLCAAIASLERKGDPARGLPARPPRSPAYARNENAPRAVTAAGEQTHRRNPRG